LFIYQYIKTKIMGNSNRSGRTDDGKSDNTGELLTPIKGLHDNLMRQCHNRDPFQSYEVVTVLGAGSMGSVCKVKKLAMAVGGSSRAHLLHIPTLLERIQLIGKLCCGTEEEQDRTRDLLHIPSRRSSPSYHGSAADSTSDSVSTPTRVSTMVTFGHQDTFLALKSISLEKTISKALLDEMKNEVEILKKMDHPHIVRAMETYDFKQQIYIVMELCSGGDLYTRDPYTEADAARITASILSAVAYMHSMDITHRDLKYENIVSTKYKPSFSLLDQT
jgi:serine/threonine protein kinase